MANSNDFWSQLNPWKNLFDPGDTSEKQMAEAPPDGITLKYWAPQLDDLGHTEAFKDAHGNDVTIPDFWKGISDFWQNSIVDPIANMIPKPEEQELSPAVDDNGRSEIDHEWSTDVWGPNVDNNDKPENEHDTDDLVVVSSEKPFPVNGHYDLGVFGFDATANSLNAVGEYVNDPQLSMVIDYYADISNRYADITRIPDSRAQEEAMKALEKEFSEKMNTPEFKDALNNTKVKGFIKLTDEFSDLSPADRAALFNDIKNAKDAAIDYDNNRSTASIYDEKVVEAATRFEAAYNSFSDNVDRISESFTTVSPYPDIANRVIDQIENSGTASSTDKSASKGTHSLTERPDKHLVGHPPFNTIKDNVKDDDGVELGG